MDRIEWRLHGFPPPKLHLFLLYVRSMIGRWALVQCRIDLCFGHTPSECQVNQLQPIELEPETHVRRPLEVAQGRFQP